MHAFLSLYISHSAHRASILQDLFLMQFFFVIYILHLFFFLITHIHFKKNWHMCKFCHSSVLQDVVPNVNVFL